MYEPNCVPIVVALRISLFCRDSSRWSPKRSPFTVGVCTYSGHSPSPLHYLEETNPPKAALRACGKEDPHAMSPHCGYRLRARRGGRDWRGEGGRPGAGSAACTVPHPTPAQATPGYGSGSCSDRGDPKRPPGTPRRNGRERGTARTRKNGKLLFAEICSPAARTCPSGSPCAFKSVYRQRNPRLPFLGIHSGVCLWVFLFKTTLVGTNREEPRCNKIRTRYDRS